MIISFCTVCKVLPRCGGFVRHLHSVLGAGRVLRARLRVLRQPLAARDQGEDLRRDTGHAQQQVNHIVWFVTKGVAKQDEMAKFLRD